MDRLPDDSSGAKKSDRSLPEFFKRAFLSGADALLTSEDGIRSFFGEMKLPKDAIQYLSNQMAKSKEDLSKILSKELREFLQSTDLVAVFKRVLSSISLEINTKVRFIDESDSLRPKTETNVRIKKVEKASYRRNRAK